MDWLLVVFVFFSSRVVPLFMGKVRKRWCCVTCESAFRVARVGLCRAQAKVASRCSNRVAPLSMGKVRKGDVLWRAKVHFAWQAWDFVAPGRKLPRDSLIASSRCLSGKWEKVMLYDVWQCMSQGVGLCGTQAKVSSQLSNVYATRYRSGKWDKVMCCDVWN